MKQNKKGFTLIELLAVIVILAIIALIAVPVVMNIISKARKSAAADTAYSILKSAELYYADQLLTDPTEVFNGVTFSFNPIVGANEVAGSELDIKGTKPTAGKVTLDANGKASVGADGLTINGFACTENDKGVITCDTPKANS